MKKLLVTILLLTLVFALGCTDGELTIEGNLTVNTTDNPEIAAGKDLHISGEADFILPGAEADQDGDGIPDQLTMHMEVSDEPYVPDVSAHNFDNMRCVMSQPDGTVTMYFKGNKFKQMAESRQGTVHMLNDGVNFYTWQNDRGMKMPLDLMQGGNQPGIAQLGQSMKSFETATDEVKARLEAAGAQITCEDGVVTDEDLALPSSNDVAFQDIAEMVAAMG